MVSVPLPNDQAEADTLTTAIIDRDDLQSLFDALEACDYQIIGPTERAGEIIYEPVHAVADLPIGWTEKRDLGTHGLQEFPNQAVFDFAVGPRAWQEYPHLSPANLPRAKRGDRTVTSPQECEELPCWAVIGVRSCDLHPPAGKDRPCPEGTYRLPAHTAQRQDLFIVALNRQQTGDSFNRCSIGTVRGGFDLALTEVLRENQHYFLVEIGSKRGAAVLDVVPHRPAGHAEQSSAVTRPTFASRSRAHNEPFHICCAGADSG